MAKVEVEKEELKERGGMFTPSSDESWSIHERLSVVSNPGFY